MIKQVAIVLSTGADSKYVEHLCRRAKIALFGLSQKIITVLLNFEFYS